jgi:hypothetical protein
MKSLIMFSVLLFAACSHRSGDATTPGGAATAASDTEPAVDPTLPSWAPRSCSGYHAAVIKLAACEAVPQETRDAATAKYDADHAKWQAMQDQPQGAIDEVGQYCSTEMKAAQEQMSGKCT